MSRYFINQCHICQRIQNKENNWQKSRKRIPKEQIYETICQDCLANWTNSLIDELNDEKVA